MRGVTLLPTLLLARVLLLLLHDASADLPVHCLHGQILGRWVFHVGAAQELLSAQACRARVATMCLEPGRT